MFARARLRALLALCLVAAVAQGCASAAFAPKTGVAAAAVAALGEDAVRISLTHSFTPEPFVEGGFQTAYDDAAGLSFLTAAKAEAARRGWSRYDIDVQLFKATVKGRVAKGGYRSAQVDYLIEGVITNADVEPGVDRLILKAPDWDPGLRPGPGPRGAPQFEGDLS